MKFSVVVANYNNGKYLDVLIKSMLSQTYANWELIIADDNSTDNSVEIINGYLSDKVKLILHSRNMGAGAAFKSAIDAASGSIIGLLGADDALLPSALDEVVQAYSANPKASLIYTTHYRCDKDLTPISVAEWVKPLSGKLALIRMEQAVSNFVTFPQKKYLQTDGLDADQRRALDQDIYLKLEEVGEVCFLNKPLYLYRVHEAGISQGAGADKVKVFHYRAVRNAYIRRKANRFPHNLSFYWYALYSYKYFSSIHLLSENEITETNIRLKKIYWTVLFFALEFASKIKRNVF